MSTNLPKLTLLAMVTGRYITASPPKDFHTTAAQITACLEHLKMMGHYLLLLDDY
jgi:hypothetical protein